MAKGKIWYIGERQGGNNNNINYSLKDSLEYIANEEKTEVIWASGVNCLGNWESAYKDMMRTKRKFGKMNKRQAYHMIISFKETENDKEKAWDIIGKVLEELFEERFEVFYTMHTNTKHLHAHAIINSVSFKDGKKFRYEKGDWKKKFQPVIDKYALEIGFEKLDMEEDGAEPGRNMDSEKINWYKVNKEDIDTAIGEASSYEEFEILMRKMGYYLDYGNRGGDLCLKIRKAAAGQLYYRRCTEKTLGYAYTQEGIKDRIAAKEKAYPIYPVQKTPKAVCIQIRHKKGRAFRRWEELSPMEQFELKRFYVYNKRGRANYRINWQVVNLYRRKARESLYKRDLVFKYKIFGYEKFHRAEEELKLKISKIEEGRKDLYKKEKLYGKELADYREIEKLLESGNNLTAELLSRKLEKESGHTIREIRELSQGIKREKEQLKKDARICRKEYKSILSMHKEYAKANGLPLPEELKDEGDALVQHNKTGEGNQGEMAPDKGYDKDISFPELSNRKKAYAKTAAEAFNKLTSRDYSRAAYYYCCDRKNPYNFIRMKSQAAKDLKGEAYTKTEYAVFRDNEIVKNPDREDGLFTDERVKGWNSRKWTELREKMVELSGLPGDDLIMFYSEKGFKNYQKVYERDMGDRNLEKEQGRK